MVKRILKIFGWFLSAIVLLFLLVVILVTIPSVQNYLLDKITTFVSEKTHSTVSIGRIGISFPKTVVLNQVFFDDRQKDTLISAGEIRTDIDMIELIRGKISINKITISDMVANVKRKADDSLYNFSFIINSFASGSQDTVSAAQDSSASFSISMVELNNIHLSFDDRFKGIYAKTDFEKLELKTDQLDFSKLNFKIDQFSFSDGQAAITLYKKNKPAEGDTSSRLPDIFVRNINLRRIDFKFLNAPDSQFISAHTNAISIQNTVALLNTNTFSADKIESSSTSCIYKSDKKETTPVVPDDTTSPINVSVKDISLKQTSVAVDLSETRARASFDPEHLHVNGLDLEAVNTVYTESISHSDISVLSFLLDEGFSVRQLSAGVSFTPTAINVKNLRAETNHSQIKADLNCSFSSVHALKDSLAEVTVHADISKSKIDPREITFFAPQLSGLPFLMSSSLPIELECTVNGLFSDLSVARLFARAGNSTSVAASAHIKGLPATDKTFFDIEDCKITTTSDDIRANIPVKMLPEGIAFPEQVSVTGNFRGMMKAFDSNLDVESTFGKINAVIKMQPDENYEAEVSAVNFEAGKLLKDEKTFGAVTLSMNAVGKGFTKEKATATADLQIESAELFGYAYHNFRMQGKISDQHFEGTANMNDPNIAFDFKGLAGFKQGDEKYKFTLDVKGANLQKLNLVKNDIRIAGIADIDLRGNTVDNINGKAGISQIIIVKDDKTYRLDSLLFASLNEDGKTEMSLKSAVIGMDLKGSVAPGKLVPEIVNHINRYFPISDSIIPGTAKNNFTFKVTVQNNPVIADVFLPALKDFEPVTIDGSFEGKEQKLDISASMPRIEYDGNVLRNGLLKINSDASSLSYSLSASELSSGSQMLKELSVSGEAKNKTATVSLTLGEDEKKKRFAFNALLTVPQQGAYNVSLGNSITLGGNDWSAASDNAILFTKNKPLLVHFSMSRDQEMISLETKDSANLEVGFRNFELVHISDIMKTDTALAEGTLNGTFTLLGRGAFISEASLTALKIKSHAVGDLTLAAKNISASQIALEAKLTGEGNNLSVSGTVTPQQNESAMDLKINIQSLSMSGIEGFSFGQLHASSGVINGDFTCMGSFSHPKLEGAMHFTDVRTTPAILNSPVTLKNEMIRLEGNAIRFSSFTIRDSRDETAQLDGSITFSDLSNPSYDLSFTSNHFMVMNAEQTSGQNYFGTVVLDSRIKMTGSVSSAKIIASVKLDEGSRLGIAIPETRLTADRGEGVVEFTNAGLDPILNENTTKENQKSTFRNLEVTADIQVDKDASLKIIVDPASGDSLVVKGDAALSFTLDQGGTMSLTGRYELLEGSYLVSLQDLVKKRFVIEKGSTISWNGDPMDADVDMRAIYTVRTSPIDLVANQLTGAADAERNKFKERIPFEVVLKLKGELLKPDIAFEIQLPQENRGAMGGAVNAKLSQLNEDESELNKQVFALLVLNRFVQEDPLASESGSGAEGIARQSVGRFLSQQLNQWSSRHISGVELNFDVESYDDYSTGQSEGRTQVDIGLKKQFNDRFSVQVGGSVDVEGERTRQNNLGDLAGDILVEYKLTEDGRYRLRGFRQNEYEGIIEGQLTETGAGIMYTKDFDRWRDLFKKNREENDK
jgi:translocation and assembly module TamB